MEVLTKLLEASRAPNAPAAPETLLSLPPTPQPQSSIPLGEFDHEEDKITMDVVAENTAMCCVPWGMEREALMLRLRWAEELPPGARLHVEAGPSDCKRAGFKHFIVRKIDALDARKPGDAAA